eukprot:tig00000310_g23995.t1
MAGQQPLYQWRSFRFFLDSEVKEEGADEALSVFSQPAGSSAKSAVRAEVTSCSSCEGCPYIFFGDSLGRLHAVDPQFHAATWQGHDTRVNHVLAVHGKDVLVSEGDDVSNASAGSRPPTVKMWTYDRSAPRFDPALARSIELFPGHVQEIPITCLCVSDDVGLVAMGCEDGDVLLLRAQPDRDLVTERIPPLRQRLLAARRNADASVHGARKPLPPAVTGLAYRPAELPQSLAPSPLSGLTPLLQPQGPAAPSTPSAPSSSASLGGTPAGARRGTLYVVTRRAIASYSLGPADARRVYVQEPGAPPNCATLMGDASPDYALGREEALYVYQPDDRGPCYAFPGTKRYLAWHRNYLVTVMRGRPEEPGPGAEPGATPPAPEDAGSGDDAGPPDVVRVYDVASHVVAFEAELPARIRFVVAAWGRVFLVLRDLRVIRLTEVSLADKLHILYGAHQYSTALAVARTHGAAPALLAAVHRKFGDHLSELSFLSETGDWDGAAQQWSLALYQHAAQAAQRYPQGDAGQPGARPAGPPIPHGESSRVIRRLVDGGKIEHLAKFLETLHLCKGASGEHTTLLLQCYVKLRDTERLARFIGRKGADDDQEAAQAAAEADARSGSEGEEAGAEEAPDAAEAPSAAAAEGEQQPPPASQRSRRRLAPRRSGSPERPGRKSGRKSELEAEKEKEKEKEKGAARHSFDVRAAIAACSAAGLHSHALYLARRHGLHAAYLRIQLEELRDAAAALAHLRRLPFDAALAHALQFGRELLRQLPAEATGLLVDLVSGNFAAALPPRPRQRPRRPLGRLLAPPAPAAGRPSGSSSSRPVSSRALPPALATPPAPSRRQRADPEPFLPLFGPEHGAELLSFLEAAAAAAAGPPPRAWRTRSSSACCRRARRGRGRGRRAWRRRRRPRASTRTTGCSSATPSPSGRAWWRCWAAWASAGSCCGSTSRPATPTPSSPPAPPRPGGPAPDPHAWGAALRFFARNARRFPGHLARALDAVEATGALSPLLVFRALAAGAAEGGEGGLTLGDVRGYLSKTLAWGRESSKCAACASPLDLPASHFGCGHAYHGRCLERAPSGGECPLCLPAWRQLEAVRGRLEAAPSSERHRELLAELGRAAPREDGFRLIPEFLAHARAGPLPAPSSSA